MNNKNPFFRGKEYTPYEEEEASSFTEEQQYPNIDVGVASSSLISPQTSQHLQRVYRQLGLTVLAAAGAAALQAYDYLPMAGSFPMLLGLMLLFAIRLLSPNAIITGHNMGNNFIINGNFNASNWAWLRPWMLYGFGFLEGWGLSPLTTALLDADPLLLGQALLFSILIFASFSMTAVMSRRRTFLAYGGVLMSGLIILSVMAMGNLFFPTRIVFDVILYGGLLIFAFLVAYHTQVIVEVSEQALYYHPQSTDSPSRNAALDDVTHATMLFDDLISLFIRIALIMLQQEQRRRPTSYRRDNERRRR